MKLMHQVRKCGGAPGRPERGWTWPRARLPPSTCSWRPSATGSPPRQSLTTWSPAAPEAQPYLGAVGDSLLQKVLQLLPAPMFLLEESCLGIVGVECFFTNQVVLRAHLHPDTLLGGEYGEGVCIDGSCTGVGTFKQQGLQEAISK